MDNGQLIMENGWRNPTNLEPKTIDAGRRKKDEGTSRVRAQTPLRLTLSRLTVDNAKRSNQNQP
jgi:hypothetical protein